MATMDPALKTRLITAGLEEEHIAALEKAGLTSEKRLRHLKEADLIDIGVGKFVARDLIEELNPAQPAAPAPCRFCRFSPKHRTGPIKKSSLINGDFFC
ncbi:MAG: hypothetical protein KBD15_01475 [Candidatus Magasanikbacteria bacterium]|jgi:hypothetical protein|nr:hypothetical protein [Candidatus Magasanikbacteria bacterium]